MCGRGQAKREQQRLRMRHGVPDVKMTVFVRQKCYLEPREKITCADVRRVRGIGVVFTGSRDWATMQECSRGAPWAAYQSRAWWRMHVVGRSVVHEVSLVTR